MKKLFILILFITGVNLFADELNHIDKKYGMSIDEVVRREGVPAEKYIRNIGASISIDCLLYEDIRAAGLQADSDICFIDDQKAGVIYEYYRKQNRADDGSVHPDNLITAFYYLNNKLIELHGECNDTNAVPKQIDEPLSIMDIVLKDDPDGSMYFSNWKTGNGYVELYLIHEKKWRLKICYLSSALYSIITDNGINVYDF